MLGNLKEIRGTSGKLRELREVGGILRNFEGKLRFQEILSKLEALRGSSRNFVEGKETSRQLEELRGS